MKNGFVHSFFLVCLTLSGCNGSIETVLNPELGATAQKNRTLDGILVYPLKQVVEVTETTALIDEKSKVILGSAPDACTPKRALQFTTRADFSDPYLLRYSPGLFETNQFGITLKDGTLAGVNSQSDPSKAATAAASLLPFVVAPVSAGFAPGKPFCNDGPKLIGVYEAPKTLPFSQISQ